MIYGVYAVKDLKTGYLPLTYDVNDDSAIRNFTLACNANKNSVFFQFPGDYQLWKIGSYDTSNGKIISDLKFLIDAPQHLDIDVESDKDGDNDGIQNNSR